jgi:polyvinyl alcohol dehydrogenase (cytochrome)
MSILHKSGWFAGAFLAGALAWLCADSQFLRAAPARASQQAPGELPGIDLKLGEGLYRDRCAACHDHPIDRIPAKSVIANYTPAFIMSALRGGVMSAQASGLSERELADIALSLSNNRQGGVLAATNDVAPECSGDRPPFGLDGPGWNGWGHDVGNSRFQGDPGLGAADVPRLKVKWAIGLAGDRAGQPTIVGGRLFTNDTAGVVYALDAHTGCVFWRFAAASGTRTTIVVGPLPPSAAPARFAVYFADQARDVVALDAETGRLLWKSHVDDQPATQMTGSLVLDAGKLYVPISSGEEFFATLPNYQCCKFRGAVAALDAATGRILWKTYTTPNAPQAFKNASGRPMFGPAGGAVWSAPTIDTKRHLVYVGTGNSYTEIAHAGSDAVIALDMDTGAIRWINQLTKGDDYVIGCYPGQARGPNCPSELGNDYDIGASPILHALPSGKDVLLVGQKSSQVYALDPDDKGRVLWTQRLSVGGPLGGVEFGPAADPANIYVAISDIYLRALARPGLTAIRIDDGKILWSTPAPHAPCRWTNEYCTPAQSQAVSAIPGIVFSGAMDGHLRAYSATDGAIVWDYDTAHAPYRTLSDRSVEGGVLDGAGPTIAGGMLYVNTGYWGRSGGNTVLLAFSVDGK